jgi:hypothetical protein
VWHCERASCFPPCFSEPNRFNKRQNDNTNYVSTRFSLKKKIEGAMAAEFHIATKFISMLVEKDYSYVNILSAWKCPNKESVTSYHILSFQRHKFH